MWAGRAGWGIRHLFAQISEVAEVVGVEVACGEHLAQVGTVRDVRGATGSDCEWHSAITTGLHSNDLRGDLPSPELPGSGHRGRHPASSAFGLSAHPPHVSVSPLHVCQHRAPSSPRRPTVMFRDPSDAAGRGKGLLVTGPSVRRHGSRRSAQQLTRVRPGLPWM